MTRRATSRKGKIGLVLGAGNVASIAPLDCLHKLLVEHQVVLLKMNPVNDYLIDFLRPALRPLIEFGALRIVRGGADVGAYLCNHDLVDDIHITGAAASHDAIVWGPGEEGRKNKAAGTPRNSRRITSELGGVAPTIVVPGPWSNADIAYHAELIATQKLNNSGFNCIACQMLVLPEGWDKSDALLAALEKVMQKAPVAAGLLSRRHRAPRRLRSACRQRAEIRAPRRAGLRGGAVSAGHGRLSRKCRSVRTGAQRHAAAVRRRRILSARRCRLRE